MLTAAITAAVAAILHVFGVNASVGQLAVVAIVVKVLIVLTGVLVGGRLMKRRQEKAAAEAQAPQPPKP